MVRGCSCSWLLHHPRLLLRTGFEMATAALLDCRCARLYRHFAVQHPGCWNYQGDDRIFLHNGLGSLRRFPFLIQKQRNPRGKSKSMIAFKHFISITKILNNKSSILIIPTLEEGTLFLDTYRCHVSALKCSPVFL